MSAVTEIDAAPSAEALRHFEAMLSYETDCSDVHMSMASGTPDFVLLDVRSPQLFAQWHIPGAINLPYGKITLRRMEEWPQSALFVVYCAGPHCNATEKAAIRLARLGRPVKKMIGGITGWVGEGYALVHD